MCLTFCELGSTIQNYMAANAEAPRPVNSDQGITELAPVLCFFSMEIADMRHTLGNLCPEDTHDLVVPKNPLRRRVWKLLGSERMQEHIDGLDKRLLGYEEAVALINSGKTERAEDILESEARVSWNRSRAHNKGNLDELIQQNRVNELLNLLGIINPQRAKSVRESL